MFGLTDRKFSLACHQWPKQITVSSFELSAPPTASRSGRGRSQGSTPVLEKEKGCTGAPHPLQYGTVTHNCSGWSFQIAEIS